MPCCRQQALQAAADAIAETAAWMQTHQFLTADELGVLGHLVRGIRPSHGFYLW